MASPVTLHLRWARSIMWGRRSGLAGITDHQHGRVRVMAEMDVGTTELFGFPRSEWVASGALSEGACDFLVAAAARGERTSVTTAGWVALARLSPAHARRVWELHGEDWTRQVAALEITLERGAAPAEADAIARFHAHAAARLYELRRLVGRDD